MKKLVFLFVLVASVTIGKTVTAQETAWVQIESQPSLQAGETRARAYSGAFDNVAGFAIGGSWYAIALGPYTREDATRRLRQLRRENLIPSDSFVAFSRSFRQQFWPVGANVLANPPILPERGDDDAVAEIPTTPEEVIIPDETPRQARRSEALLSREERELLQTALKSEGFYDAAIDGAFGRGTRAAMAAYQEAMGYEASGVLTTQQRLELIEAYNSILDGLDLEIVRNEEAGIEVKIPTAMVEFSRFEPPFVHYDSTTDEGIRVLLISQEGTQATLFGLYDIMQTLEIVPLEGERERKSASFTLTGQNDEISSYTYAALVEGQIKGFTLVWPAGDERRMRRVVREMQASFAPFGEALDEMLGAPDEDQRIDLLAGLEIRRPDVSRTGFYIDAQGTVLTTSEVVSQCREITLNEDQEAEVAFVDEALGIAVLRPTSSLSPIAYASFRNTVARIKSDVAVAGFPYGGVLNAPTLTFGQLEDIRGLDGEENLNRLALAPREGDAGGPVFDSAGAVIGMLLPKPTGGQQLPDEVSFSAKAQSVKDALEANGVTVSDAEANEQMAPEALTRLAADMTVLVSCWN
ncbi:trypsin-like peptidase domain-containing protein [Aliiroseovarius sp. YM-037]|uniref:trypsin-like peptidase domain-containing protein n=1 Tax=Aliiroseovarius sp. YM-037 TaxID=3341728 RepID=UPI003A81330E